jgi:release factor glutamine methyltransferase
MKILELIQKTTAYFEKAGVPNPRLDIELLLSHVLGLKRMDLYIQFERDLAESEMEKLRPFVKRRASREPLQHILGTVEFCDVKLQVSPAALIPRPETELLVETVLQQFAADQEFRFVDVGTGTGAISLALLKARPRAFGVAIDISPEALELAKKNTAENQLQDRIEFRQGSVFQPLQSNEQFELIVSNPPYIPTEVISSLQAEVQYDPKLALDGGADGLQIISLLIKESKSFLKDQGFLIFEVGHDQKQSVDELLRNNGYADISFIQDLQKRDRICCAR